MQPRLQGPCLPNTACEPQGSSPQRGSGAHLSGFSFPTAQCAQKPHPALTRVSGRSEQPTCREDLRVQVCGVCEGLLPCPFSGLLGHGGTHCCTGRMLTKWRCACLPAVLGTLELPAPSLLYADPPFPPFHVISAGLWQVCRDPAVSRTDTPRVLKRQGRHPWSPVSRGHWELFRLRV